MPHGTKKVGALRTGAFRPTQSTDLSIKGSGVFFVVVLVVVVFFPHSFNVRSVRFVENSFIFLLYIHLHLKASAIL